MTRINESYFSLDLPSNWIMQHDSLANLYSFYSTDKKALGVLQLTVFTSDKHHWNPQYWLEDFTNAIIIEISDYQSIYYTENQLEKNSIIYHWIIGSNMKMIHLTYTVGSHGYLENELETVKNILTTLIIK